VGCFIQVFPQPRIPGFTTRLLNALVRIAGIAGVVLFSANALAGWAVTPSGLAMITALQRTRAGGTIYWTITFAVILLMLPLSLAGTGRLDQNMRRRVRVFLGAFVVGLGPLVVALVLMATPGLGRPVTAWAIRPVPLAIIEICLASIPITVAYAVVVQRVLPVRVVMRLAVQYLLARWTATAAFMIPVALVAVQGYRLRHETIADAIAGSGVWLVATTVVAGLVLFSREELRRTIDRWFFREAYDAREILMTLGEQSRRAHRLDEFVATITAGIDRALRPESVAVLIMGDLGEQFISPFGSVEPLATKGVLADALAVSHRPIDVRVDDARSPLRWLPRGDRQWLVDSRASLLVPMRDAGGGLVGLITIGERRSEMPFSTEDRWLLVAIADAGALTIENHAMRVASGGDGAREDAWRVGLEPERTRAAECPACGLLHASVSTTCVRCGALLRPSDVPAVLFGKFRFEERVGRGGMGVVYRATDLALDRVVAIKTLPGTSPEHSQRLRVEAKAMAAVTHRHLAIIHGAESWRGRPMLICEFMTHGTLADRLGAGSLPIAEALALGMALADALRVIHAAGLLHRDIKPSNIGYSRDRVPKLLDFGLVHILTQAPRDDGDSGGAAAGPTGDSDLLLSLSVSRPFVGTPLYLSPEATHGRRPTAAYDLWSLNVLLIEAITGRHPFRGATVEDTLSRIRSARLEEAWVAGPPVPGNLTAYFSRALARDPASRIKSAGDVAESLRTLACEF
jgi:hypothetical protein